MLGSCRLVEEKLGEGHHLAMGPVQQDPPNLLPYGRATGFARGEAANPPLLQVPLQPLDLGGLSASLHPLKSDEKRHTPPVVTI